MNDFNLKILEYYFKVKNIKKVAQKFNLKTDNVRFIIRQYYLNCPKKN